MLKKLIVSLIALAALLVLSPFILDAMITDPQGNPATFEDTPLSPGIADPSQALTFAQLPGPDGLITTILVTSAEGTHVQGVDLSALNAERSGDVFDAVASVDQTVLLAAFSDPGLQRSYRIRDLLPSGGPADRHVASGTNFPEHAEESSSEDVFNFPKFGHATPAVTRVVHQPGMLLDYEVELCVRFDRDIETISDFDAARKGFFLCADFTDRATLVRLIDPSNPFSTVGFSDAKSGPDFFPTGPFIVLPQDWQAFVANERMMTRVNGDDRQDARGGEMILNFRQLAEKALRDGAGVTYTYQGGDVQLIPDGVIRRGMTLMSGTSEGVIFTPPTLADYAAGVFSAVMSGAIFDGEAAMTVFKETFIERELASDHFLRPGDALEYSSSTLGTTHITVVAPE